MKDLNPKSMMISDDDEKVGSLMIRFFCFTFQVRHPNSKKIKKKLMPTLYKQVEGTRARVRYHAREMNRKEHRMAT